MRYDTRELLQTRPRCPTKRLESCQAHCQRTVTLHSPRGKGSADDEKEEPFAVGDLVRIPVKKAKFATDRENCSRELYVVAEVNVRTLKLLNEHEYLLRKLWKKSKMSKVPAASSGIVGTTSKKVDKNNIADKEARIERILIREAILEQKLRFNGN